MSPLSVATLWKQLVTTALCALALAGTAVSSAAAQDEVEGADWRDGAVCYEIFARSFYDSDGDGVGDP